MVAERFKISQAARMVGVKPFVLRFWESEFPELRPHRTPKGQRSYSQSHVDLALRIRALLYDEGLTIEGARRRLREGGEVDVLRAVAQELAAIRRLLSPGRS